MHAILTGVSRAEEGKEQTRWNPREREMALDLLERRK
jgi:hypothetical protein